MIYSHPCLTASLSLRKCYFTNYPVFGKDNYGADRGIRTHDPLFTKQPLWPLSYVGKSDVIVANLGLLDNDSLRRANHPFRLA